MALWTGSSGDAWRGETTSRHSPRRRSMARLAIGMAAALSWFGLALTGSALAGSTSVPMAEVEAGWNETPHRYEPIPCPRRRAKRGLAEECTCWDLRERGARLALGDVVLTVQPHGRSKVQHLTMCVAPDVQMTPDVIEAVLWPLFVWGVSGEGGAGLQLDGDEEMLAKLRDTPVPYHPETAGFRLAFSGGPWSRRVALMLHVP